MARGLLWSLKQEGHVPAASRYVQRTESRAPGSQAIGVSLSPGDTIGEYRILRLLEQGGMGTVFLAVHERIKRRVAIKVLHPQLGQDREAVQRFLDEARAANIVAHPGTVAISDVGETHGGLPYLVMEYVEGKTLRSRLIRAGGPLPPATALRLGCQIAAVLAEAHQKGIIHRDLKPENVMLIPDPLVLGGERTKLLDFGIAKLAPEHDPPGDGRLRTRTGVVYGTPEYMSPEQWRGTGTVDDRTDVYALGVLLYEMLCGRPPFLGTGPGELMGRHLFVPPPQLQGTGVTGEIAALVHAMLAKTPAARPSMTEAVVWLRRLEVEAMGAHTVVVSRIGSPVWLDPSTLDRAPAQVGGPIAQGRRQVVSPVMIGVVVLVMAIMAAGVRRLRHQPRPATRSTVTLPTPLRSVASASAPRTADRMAPAVHRAEPAAPPVLRPEVRSPSRERRHHQPRRPVRVVDLRRLPEINDGARPAPAVKIGWVDPFSTGRPLAARPDSQMSREISMATCESRDTSRAAEVFQRLDEAGRGFMRYTCERYGLLYQGDGRFRIAR
jgi:serine/threonine protein kinase